jgi:hypothetical protein
MGSLTVQGRRQTNTTDRNSGDRNTAFGRLGEDMERAKAVRVRALDNARSDIAAQRDDHGRKRRKRALEKDVRYACTGLVPIRVPWKRMVSFFLSSSTGHLSPAQDVSWAKTCARYRRLSGCKQRWDD